MNEKCFSKVSRKMISNEKWILCVILIMALPIGYANAFIIVDNGIVKTRIYISSKTREKLNDKEKTLEKEFSDSINDLIYHIKRMSGAELQVEKVKDVSEIKFPAIVIGQLAVDLGAYPKIRQKTLCGESFRIIVKRDRILIGGKGKAGFVYGIYELLERLGCDWVMPGKWGEIIPLRKSITIKDNIDITQSPDFLVRAAWYSGGSKIITKKELQEFAVWKRRKKQTLVRENMAHPLMMIGGHVWSGLIRRYKKEFERHPEMLALVRTPDGALVRKGPQIETTNAHILDIFEDYIKGIYKKNHWPKDKLCCIGIGPADGLGFSQSPETLAALSGRIDPMIGDYDRTDTLILLANKILERMGKEYPNLHLGFYLYSVHGDFPMRYKPNPRIVIVLADIEYSRFHSIIDKNSKTRTYYRHILEQWARLAKQQGNVIWFRGYNWNLAEDMLPYSKLRIWGNDMLYYYKMGVLGQYVEVTKGWAVTGPSDYLLAELSWNVHQDWHDVLKKYCKNAFGAGGHYLEQYYLDVTERQHKKGFEAGSYHSFGLIYDEEFVKHAKDLFDKAYKAARREDEKKRILGFRQPVESLEMFLKYRRALLKYDFITAKQYYERMLDIYRKYYAMNSNLISKYVKHYLSRFMKEMIEEGAKYSGGNYRIVYRIPDKLKTIFDPTVSGQEMAFQESEINDSDFIETHTITTNWDAQGLGFYRKGAVWYRIHFPIVQSLRNKPIGLFIGGVDDEVRVWINGKYVGFGRGFSKPFVFDLTDGIAYETNNLLALQVIRRCPVNELGTGGILYPCYIFTGPRLKNKAPHLEKMKRILPGGAFEENGN